MSNHICEVKQIQSKYIKMDGTDFMSKPPAIKKLSFGNI